MIPLVFTTHACVLVLVYKHPTHACVLVLVYKHQTPACVLVLVYKHQTHTCVLALVYKHETYTVVFTLVYKHETHTGVFALAYKHETHAVVLALVAEMRKCENENIKVLQQSQGTGLFRIQKTFVFRDLRALRARFFSHFRYFFLEKHCFFKVLWVNELCQQESMSHL